jgi:diguanylate cyclase (GGDEF)-like protein
MPVSALASLDYSRYVTLLREVLPRSADIFIRDAIGTLISSNTGGEAAAGGDCGEKCSGCPLSAKRVDRSLQIGRDADYTCYSMMIFNPADELAGSLSVVVPAGPTVATLLSTEQVERVLNSTVTCIEKELRLTIELDAMAQELASRYEELNLVYENTEEEAVTASDSEVFNRLVEDYVDYLGVDLVALVFTSQNRTFIAAGGQDPVTDPYGVIREVIEKYLPAAQEGNSLLLMNDFNDRSARELGLEVPYKVIATPVQNNRGEVEGILVSLNHLYRADFYNSDKNLLSVMAKKAAKILLANFDSLTGLNNQAVFDHVLARALETATSQGQAHCLLNTDLGSMRILNDSHGREAGDAAIRHVSRLLRNKLRNTDSIAYLGEGRYGILLERCVLELGESVADNLRNLVADNPLVWEGKSVALEISTGIAQVDPHCKSIDEVVEAAEIARQSAKQLGHGQIQTFHQGDAGLMDHKQRLKWVSRIREAMHEDRFRIYCQVIEPTGPVDEAFHFEILLRLLDKEGDIVGASEFIPPAEQFNLMPMIDRWVIETTFSMLSEADYARSPDEGMVAINLSGQSLSDWELPDYIARKLDESGIESSCVCFEITETVAFRDSEQALSCMHAIKALGCSLSLDDFGTGLSSFSYLKDLPVDYLKIDGSFVRKILDDNVSHAMVASINQIGHVMGLKTVAEFVENDALADRLVEMDIDYLQGYAIAKPMPLDDYLDALDIAASASAGRAS